MKTNKISLSPNGYKAKCSVIILVSAFAFIISVLVLDLDLIKFITRLKNAPEVIRRMLILDFNNIGEITASMGISFALAVTALMAGVIISVPLSFLAAENITPSRYPAKIIKAVIAVIRAVPSLVWVLMVVASIGFGNTGGMIGLMFPVTGYLTKSFTASIEEQGIDLIEALQATGASWINIVMNGLFPSVFPAFITWISIRLEANLAESISLGMVGVAGIGMLLSKAAKQYNYGQISTIILVIFISMFLLEVFMTLIRSRIDRFNA